MTNPNTTIVVAVNELLVHTRTLLARLRGAMLIKSTQFLPARFAKNPRQSELRVTHLANWVVALARTLAGDRTYLPRPTPPRSETARLQASITPRARAARPSTAPQREARRNIARLRTMQFVFSTRPTAQIAASLARRLGVKPGSDAWPTELLAITETPAQWGARIRALPDGTPDPRAPEPKPITAIPWIPTPPEPETSLRALLRRMGPPPRLVPS